MATVATANPSRETLTLAQLAETLDISMTTAYEMARAGTLPIPTLRLGRQFRFSRRALERWLDSDAGQHDDAA
jgi:excisionase family DNA binding protein